MPLSASLQLKLMVTAELFQPAAFGAGLTVAVIVGGVRSTMSAGAGLIVDGPPAFVPLMVSVCEPSPPRLKFESDQVPLVIVAGVPLTVTEVAVPGPPLRFTVLELTNDPGAGSVSESTGGGMVMTETCATPMLFAASVAVAVMVTGELPPLKFSVTCHVPSAAIVAGCPLTCTVTAVSSLTVPVTVTWLGLETGVLSVGAVMVTVGLTSSMSRV